MSRSGAESALSVKQINVNRAATCFAMCTAPSQRPDRCARVVRAKLWRAEPPRSRLARTFCRVVLVHSCLKFG